ncbi:MAG: anti-sigma-F factor Fin family protein [Thermoactinomyces sp.]
MAIRYICRHCQKSIGTIDSPLVTESQLGFDQLTPEERKDIITSDIDGNRVVRVTCETCQDVLENNPERLLFPSLFH